MGLFVPSTWFMVRYLIIPKFGEFTRPLPKSQFAVDICCTCRRIEKTPWKHKDQNCVSIVQDTQLVSHTTDLDVNYTRFLGKAMGSAAYATVLLSDI